MTLHLLVLSLLFSAGAALNALNHAWVAVKQKKKYPTITAYLSDFWIPLLHRAVIEAGFVWLLAHNEALLHEFIGATVGLSAAGAIEGVLSLFGGLFGDVLIEKVVAKFPWIAVPPLDENGSSSGPGATGGTAALVMATLLLGGTLGLTVPLTGCAARSGLQTSTPAAPNHPDQADDLDGYAYDTLNVAQAVLDEAKRQYAHGDFESDRELAKEVINDAGAVYDLARLSRATYHDVKLGFAQGDAATLAADLQHDLSELAPALAKVKALHRTAPAGGKQ